MADPKNGELLSPLFAVRVGSLAKSDWGQFKLAVIRPGYTKLTGDADQFDFMSGTSTYTNNKNSFHINVGISGSYYAGPVKASGSLAIGYSSAHSDTKQDIDLTMNALRYSGVEVLDFDDLSFGDFFDILDKNVAADLEVVLDRFLESRAAGDQGEPLLRWQGAVQSFLRQHGDGMVVGVVWGGLGMVKLHIHVESSDDKWAFAQSFNLSIQTFAGGGSIDEALGMKGSKAGFKKNAELSARSQGACVQKVIEAWETSLRAKLESAVTDIGATAVADLSDPGAKAPAIPEPKKPVAKGGLLDKIDKIKDLSGLELYAKAEAYDKYKESHPEATFEEFEEASKNKVDASNIPDDPYDADDESDFDEGVPSGSDTDEALKWGVEPSGNLLEASDKPSGNAFEPGGDFVVLGAWIAPWRNICPWLATAQINDVDADGSKMIGRSMRVIASQHAMTSLTGIYQRMAAEGVYGLPKAGPSGAVDIPVRELVNEFSHALESISQSLGHGSEFAYSKLNKEVLPRMSADARTIYETWSNTPELRACELGAGILFQYPTSSTLLNIEGVVGSQTEWNGENFPDFNEMATEFSYENWNLPAFARTVKAWPFILPNGKISAFIGGPRISDDSGNLMSDAKKTGLPSFGSGVLLATDAKDAVYSQMTTTREPSSWLDQLITFTPELHFGNPTLAYPGSGKKFSSAGDIYVRLIPLPYRSAIGVREWQGAAMTPDLFDTKDQIAKIKNALGDLPSVDMDVSSWTDALSISPSMNRLRPTYVGIVPEPPNVYLKDS